VIRKQATKPKAKPIALAALKRAAKDALELGRRTGTPVYVLKDGKIVDLLQSARKRGKKKNGRA
jgi:hypothetical protein